MNGYAPRKPGMRKILYVVALLAFTSAHAQWIDSGATGSQIRTTGKRSAALAQRLFLLRTQESSRSGGVLPRRP
jgi:hypothetical protein